MSEFKINGRFRLICPEGFRPMTKEQRTQLRIAEDGDILCLSSEDGNMAVSIGWKEIPYRASLILHILPPVKSVAASVERSMAPYGYRKEEDLTRQIGGQNAAGFRYTYTAGTSMVGETYVIHQGKALTFFHMYLRGESREQGLVQWSTLLDAVQPL